MARRSKQLIAMSIVFVLSIAFICWAPGTWLTLLVGATGYLTMVVPQLYWLHLEEKEMEETIRKRIW